jgi:hypothetical protein
MIRPYYEQELQHLEITIDQVNKSTELGAYLEISYENLQLELGHPGPITNLDYDLWAPSTTPTWVHSWWKFCTNHSLTMHTPSCADLPLARANDQYLMQVFSTLPNTDSATLRELNICRMYLQVITLADITTATGDYIETPSILEGTPPTQCWHTLDWPRQPPKLPQKFWNTWKKTIS